MSYSFSAIYTSSSVHDKIQKIAANNYGCNYDDIGQVWPKKKTVQKEDSDETKTILCFDVFDESLEFIGTVTRSEVRNYANGKSDN